MDCGGFLATGKILGAQGQAAGAPAQPRAGRAGQKAGRRAAIGAGHMVGQQLTEGMRSVAGELAGDDAFDRLAAVAAGSLPAASRAIGCLWVVDRASAFAVGLEVGGDLVA